MVDVPEANFRILDCKAQPLFGIAQCGVAAVDLGGLVAADEKAGDRARVIPDRFEHKVDILRVGAAVQAQLHAAGDHALAVVKGVLERFEITLPLMSAKTSRNRRPTKSARSEIAT